MPRRKSEANGAQFTLRPVFSEHTEIKGTNVQSFTSDNAEGEATDRFPLTRTGLSAHASGTLWIVSVPIGNPEDITLRALRILREVSLVIAENRQVTQKLFTAYNINTEVLTYRQQRGQDPANSLLQRLQAGESLALVCDRGTPGIADPGALFLRRVMLEGIPVSVAPGATALVAGLTLSGFAGGSFVFEGFPPRNHSDRELFIERVAIEKRALILYETPAYLSSTLALLVEALGQKRSIAVLRDLTQKNEEVFRGSLQEAQQHFRQRVSRGQFTLVIAKVSAISREESEKPSQK